MNAPEISVIVPVYNVEKYLCRCVDSILNQTFRDFELILVDDGSPDNSGAICDEYAAKDSRVVVIHRENGGLSAARNVGIDWTFANSNSEWLTFIDSDDWVHPEYLERLLNAAIESNVDVSVCGYTKIAGEALQVAPEQLAVQLWTPEDLFVNYNVNAIVAWGKLYRKECFREVRYPVGKIHEDEFTTYKIIFPCGRLAYIPAGMYAYFNNAEGITKSEWSPKHLVGIDAIEEQISYFADNKFPKACRKAKWCILWLYEDYIKTLENKRMYANLIYSLRKDLRLKLLQYRTDLLISVGKEPGLYEAAYPGLMRLYWLWLALLNKLKLRRK